MAMAAYLHSQGQNPLAAIERALEACRQVRRLNPELAVNDIHEGLAYTWKCEYQFEIERDPTASCDLAGHAFNQGLSRNPNLSEGLIGRAKLVILRARYLASHQVAPGELLKLAEADLNRTIALEPNNSLTYHEYTRLYHCLSTWKIQQGEEAGQSIEQGLEMAKRACAFNYRKAEAHALLGMMLALLAESAKPELQPGLYERANQCLDKAIAQNKNLNFRFATYRQEMSSPRGL